MEKKTTEIKLSEIFKTILFGLILLQVAPFLFRSFHHMYHRLLQRSTKVGKILIKGSITADAVEEYVRDLTKLFEEKDIKAILLEVESSGGNPGSCQALFQEIHTLKREYPKPVLSHTISLATGGAYYVMCATDHIIATPAAVVGNISMAVLQDPQKRMAARELLTDAYDQTTKDISLGRPQLAFDRVTEWGNGQLYTGKQALERGFVDELGAFTTAEKAIRARTAIKGAIEWVEPAQPFGGLLTYLFGSSESLARNLIWMAKPMREPLRGQGG
jgi:ClpP class serine protease